eukprot:CAMPEP_0170172792 /NCGR_PEP_ID=MMETSP0040_2-20121228/6057_1 /TAXON_ID=641309 /ORGANISM="Lotharella oceanica, Strain CCMP622" /LENGTH=63 /DNA_ID=CAMNT_0010413633 /DNA_START=280 /DNA_END=471 /DNA_ORIENTATION=-
MPGELLIVKASPSSLRKENGLIELGLLGLPNDKARVAFLTPRMMSRPEIDHREIIYNFDEFCA